MVFFWKQGLQKTGALFYSQLSIGGFDAGAVSFAETAEVQSSFVLLALRSKSDPKRLGENAGYEFW
jgi:hypothetical protein